MEKKDIQILSSTRPKPKFELVEQGKNTGNMQAPKAYSNNILLTTSPDLNPTEQIFTFPLSVKGSYGKGLAKLLKGSSLRQSLTAMDFHAKY